MRVVCVAIAVLLLAGLAAPASAVSLIHLPIWIQGNVPTGDFADVADPGLGVAAALEMSAGPLSGHVGLGWNDYPSALASGESFDLWELAAGARLVVFAVAYVGLELGYYTEIDEFGLVPEVGVRFRRFDAAIRYKTIEDADWVTVRFGYRLTLR